MPHLEDVLPELGAAAFDPATDIKEVFELGGTQPGGGDTFSVDSAEGTLVYLIDWRKTRAFVRWLLGFAYADQGFPYRLHRENPATHPKYPQLTAATVHFSALAPKANDEGTGSPEPNSPNYPAVFLDFGSVSKLSYYDSVYATVRFVRRDWAFRPDGFIGDTSAPLGDPADELRRNVVGRSGASVELITAEGGVSQFAWAETSAPPPGSTVAGPATSGDASVVGNSFAIRVARTKLIVDWYWVPEDYLNADPIVPFYERLFSMNGLVNSVPFLGRPAGTLLCEPPEVLERFQFPVCTFDGLKPFFGVNLRLTFKYFNPTNLGVPDTDPTDDDKARGWRVYLYAPNQKWYGIQRQERTDPLLKWPLQEADFNDMLKHVAAS